MTSQKDNNFIKISNSLFTKKYISKTKTFFPQKSKFTVSFPKSSAKVEVLTEEAEEVSSKTIVLREKAGKLQQAVLELSKQLKNIKNEETQAELKFQDREAEVKKMIQEREKQKEIYNNLLRTKLEPRIVIESQKRLMDKYIFVTEQFNSRPSTGKKRPMTAGLRLNLAK